MIAIGIYYAVGLTAAGILVSYITHPLFAVPLFAVALFCVHFFRDPEREIPDGPVAVSPADGKVVAIVAESPHHQRISIFLSIFDVHVNRSPIGGRVRSVDYQPGRFRLATREEASTQNEMNVMVVEDKGISVIMKQIAGLVARRIICHKKPGDVVAKGERVGLIQFGSRADVILGREWKIDVRVGDRVKGGSSILAVREHTESEIT